MNQDKVVLKFVISHVQQALYELRVANKLIKKTVDENIINDLVVLNNKLIAEYKEGK